MLEKYHAFDFGRCPRVFCEGQSALPIGQSDLPRQSLAKLYCPRCQDIFYPPVAKHSRTPALPALPSRSRTRRRLLRHIFCASLPADVSGAPA